MQETQVQFLGREDPLEKEMATDYSILAWKIPWTEKPGGLQSIGSQRVRHDLRPSTACTHSIVGQLDVRGHVAQRRPLEELFSLSTRGTPILGLILDALTSSLDCRFPVESPRLAHSRRSELPVVE